MDLSPISCEITYGLERIAMFLQRVDNVFDLQWAPGVSYGAVRLREEVEQSKYAFNQDTGIDLAAYSPHSTATVRRGLLRLANGCWPPACCCRRSSTA